MVCIYTVRLIRDQQDHVVAKALDDIIHLRKVECGHINVVDSHDAVSRVEEVDSRRARGD